MRTKEQKRKSSGLEALMSSLSATKKSEPSNLTPLSNAVVLDMSLVDNNPRQHRKEFDKSELDSLAQSIKSNGVLQPIIVSPSSEAGRYIIISGERRWRASLLCGLKTVPALVVSAGDRQLDFMSLVENLQRSNINPVEEAEFLREISNKYNLSIEDMSIAIGKPRTSIANSMRINELSSYCKQMLQDGHISFGHAKVLLSLVPEEQEKYGALVVEKQLSVRDLENNLRSKNKNKNNQQNPKVDTKPLENILKEVFSREIKVECKSSVGSKITISNERLMKDLVELLKI